MDKTEFIKMLADGATDFVVSKNEVTILYHETNTEVVFRFFSDGTLRDTFTQRITGAAI
jgi:hypothetical protein